MYAYWHIPLTINYCLSQLKLFFFLRARVGGSARPLFPQWSHHVYPQFLPGSHPNAIPHHTYIRHRHSYMKHQHYQHNLNNNHHSHHHNHKIDHRYHRNSIASHPGKWYFCKSFWSSRTDMNLNRKMLLICILTHSQLLTSQIIVFYIMSCSWTASNNTNNW